MKFTIVSNNISLPGFKEEHGFSLLIEVNNKYIMFDTGQGEAFLENIKTLNIDLSVIDILVLSHGHYDHCGNISAITSATDTLQIYAHPDLIKERYSIHENRNPKIKEVGISQGNRSSFLKNNPIYNKDPIEIYSDIFITGGIPRLSFEDRGGPFFYDKFKKSVDNILDDQGIFINTDSGLIILTGCCHSGIINTVEYIRKITGKNNVKSIIGGLHLLHASDYRIERTIDYLNSLNLENIYPGHCTGADIIKRLKTDLNCSIHDLFAGETIDLL